MSPHKFWYTQKLSTSITISTVGGLNIRYYYSKRGTSKGGVSTVDAVTDVESF